ncbi:MAG: hypothetical protein J6B06_06980 [Lachnospiraceae bacterium]|nr:hypothetical protein [Lachnospiraceae bacterium]
MNHREYADDIVATSIWEFKKQKPWTENGGLICDYVDLPILSVLAVRGKSDKTVEQLVRDTKQLALSHLCGEEWCNNTQGLAAYAALKWYAWKFFEKYGEQESAEIYKSVHEAWQSAFQCKYSCDITNEKVRGQIIELLKSAQDAENKAVLKWQSDGL